MKYFYPIILKNIETEFFDLASNVKIRKITPTERKQFFGLKKAEFVYSNIRLPGLIDFHKFIPSDIEGRYPYSEIVKRGLFDGSSDILASNYLIEIDTKDSPDLLVDQINLSFKIFKPTSTGAYFGFTENETDVHIHYRMPLAGPFNYLGDKKIDINEIKKTFESIENKKNDKRFKIFSDLYSRALEGGEIHLDVRFLLLVICLESLYLPDSNLELKFRFCLRIAKLLNKLANKDINKVYNDAKLIYDIRSYIVHKGKGKGKLVDGKIFIKTTDITRLSISFYLKNKNNFTAENLTEICLI